MSLLCAQIAAVLPELCADDVRTVFALFEQDATRREVEMREAGRNGARRNWRAVGDSIAFLRGRLEDIAITEQILSHPRPSGTVKSAPTAAEVSRGGEQQGGLAGGGAQVRARAPWTAAMRCRTTAGMRGQCLLREGHSADHAFAVVHETAAERAERQAGLR